MRPNKLARAVVIFLLSAAPCFTLAESAKLTVQGNATLMVEPDLLTLTFAITARSDRAVTANREVGETMVRILKIARDHGILDADMETTGIRISEDRMGKDNCSDPGLRASQSLSLILRDLDTTEELIDQMVEGGALIQRVLPGVERIEDHHNRALELAIENARSQAGKAAEQLGLVIGSAVEVSFTSGRYTQSSNRPNSPAPTRTYHSGPIPISQSVQVVFQSVDPQ